MHQGSRVLRPAATNDERTQENGSIVVMLMLMIMVMDGWMDDTAVGGHLRQTGRQTQTLRGAMSRPGTPVRQPMVSRPPSSRCRGRGGAPPILHSIITHKGHKGKVVPRVTEMCAPKQCRLQGRVRTAETSLPGCGSSRLMNR